MKRNYTAHTFLANGSPNLLFYDFQLPLTSVRKSVKGHLVPLNLTDNREPATQPPCTEITIEISGQPDIVIHAEPLRTEFVTIKDVLRAIHRVLHLLPPAEMWDKARLQPADVMDTFRKRSERLTMLGLGKQEGSRYFPAYCDWLGSPIFFEGLVRDFSEMNMHSKKTRWIMYVRHEKVI